MLRTFFIVISGLGLIVSGCYAPRSYAPIKKERWPEKATAVLPVSPDDIQSYDPNFPAEKVAQVANAVINTETKSTEDKILGPAELLSILGDEHSLKGLTDSRNAPIDWDVQEVSKFSKRTGIETIVRINIIAFTPGEYGVTGPSGGKVGKKVVGPVEVNAELIDLSFIPPRIIYRSSGSAKYESNIGIEMGAGSTGIGIIPYAYGKTFGWALDQATREALLYLFHLKSKSNGRFIEHVSGLVQDKNTGLEWITGPDIDTTLDEAKSWVKNLSIDGGGWRLPTIVELKTLNQVIRCSITTSLKTSGWWVWTHDFHYPAWQFSFEFGFRLLKDARFPSARAFAVRSQKNDSTERAEAESKNEIETNLGGGFVSYGKGKLFDRHTGLEWFLGPDKKTTWNEAKSWVENLNTDGGGWRIPTIFELKIFYHNLAGAKDIANVLNTSGLYVWSEKNHTDKETFSKISLFNCSESPTCCDSFKKTRCFAVRSK
jgi:hypothetical protein